MGIEKDLKKVRIEKFFSEALYFSLSRDLPLEGDFKKISEAPIKTGLFIPYLVKGTENFLPEGLIFWSSRDLPLEGLFFPETPIKSPLPTHPLVRGYIEKRRSQENIFSKP